MADRLARFDAAGHGLLPSVSCPTLPTSPPPARRGRLRNGATPGDFLAAPRCGARTRAGGCCRQPAMRNGRCRMHGGLSTGPRTAEGRARCAAARRTHGFYAADTIALRRSATAHCRRMRSLLAGFGRRPTAGHGVLPSEIRSQKSEIRSARPPAQPWTSRGSALPASGFCVLASGSTAGHGLLPSFSSQPLDATRPVRRPAPRQGFVQRCLMGSTALGLGVTVAPPVTAGHGLHPSLSALSLERPARSSRRACG
jgi:hypothetical protein